MIRRQTVWRVFTADEGLVKESVSNLFKMFTGDYIYHNVLCAKITLALTIHTSMTKHKVLCRKWMPKHQNSPYHWFHINHNLCAHLYVSFFFFVTQLTDGECVSVGWLMIENLQTSITLVWRWLCHSHHSGINCSCLLFARCSSAKAHLDDSGLSWEGLNGGVRSPAFCHSLTFTKPKRSHLHSHWLSLWTGKRGCSLTLSFWKCQTSAHRTLL